jgi:hypothetical protein
MNLSPARTIAESRTRRNSGFEPDVSCGLLGCTSTATDATCRQDARATDQAGGLSYVATDTA